MNSLTDLMTTKPFIFTLLPMLKASPFQVRANPGQGHCVPIRRHVGDESGSAVGFSTLEAVSVRWTPFPGQCLPQAQQGGPRRFAPLISMHLRKLLIPCSVTHPLADHPLWEVFLAGGRHAMCG